MTHPTPALLAAVRADMASRLDGYTSELALLTAIDSGTGDHAGVRRVGAAVAARLAVLGFTIDDPARREDEDGDAGSSLPAAAVVARLDSKRPGRTTLVVGHLDTVFEAGTAARRPMTVADGRVTGPGVADMKGGVVLLLHALDALKRATGSIVPAGRLVVVLSPDEEIGSPVGSAAIRVEAAAADAALVLEPARPGGELIAARKGMVQARLTATGRAAHAGVDPERGRSAVLALAHATVALHALTNAATGVTCSVGSLHGGSRPNVVPADAALELDLRAPTPAALAQAEAELAAIAAAPAVADVQFQLVTLGRFDPMPATPGGAVLLDTASRVGSALGLEIRAIATGGASDANGIAGLGVPVLDGLGPIGGGAHSPDEYLDLASVPDRAALLAGLLLALASEPAKP